METKIDVEVVINQLQSALDELKRKRLDRNLIHDYITEALSRVKKLNEPAVIKSVCEHPWEQLESVMGDGVLCKKCNTVIKQTVL